MLPAFFQRRLLSLILLTGQLVTALLVSNSPATGTGVIVQRGSVFNGTALTSLEVQITVGGLAGAATPLSNQNGTAQWYAPGGAAAGGAVNVATPQNAVLGFPGAGAIPAAAAPSGGAINFDFPQNPTNVTASPKVVWKSVFFTWFFSPFSIDPTGAPGSGNQSWSIVGNPALGINDPVLGNHTLSVVGSNFDLSYTGSGLTYTATIDDQNSDIQLSDGSLITLPIGSTFGTFTYNSTNMGTFNFAELGLSGIFNYDPGSNLSSATAFAGSSFAAPDIALVATPEPAPSFLFVFGLVPLLWLSRRRAQRHRYEAPHRAPAA